MPLVASPRPTSRGSIRTRAERLALLEPLLARRILLLDGAMGTMIQTYRLGEAEYRGERFADRGPRAQGQQRPALPHPARDHSRHPRRLSRGGRRHHRDQLVHQHGELPGGLRPGRPGRGAEPRRGGPGSRGGGRVRAPGAGPAPVRGRRARADQPHRLALARRQRSRLPEHRRSTSWWRPTPRRRRRCSTAAPTCSSSRPSSTRSTPRPRSSRSRRSSSRSACGCRS